jgi:hypothetical protein
VFIYLHSIPETELKGIHEMSKSLFLVLAISSLSSCSEDCSKITEVPRLARRQLTTFSNSTSSFNQAPQTLLHGCLPQCQMSYPDGGYLEYIWSIEDSTSSYETVSATINGQEALTSSTVDNTETFTKITVFTFVGKLNRQYRKLTSPGQQCNCSKSNSVLLVCWPFYSV